MQTAKDIAGRGGSPGACQDVGGGGAGEPRTGIWRLEEEAEQPEVDRETAQGVDVLKAVIDSDVLIDFLQGVPEAREEMERYSEALYSVVSWMEVMCGANTEEEVGAARILFESMTRVDLSPEVAAKAVGERKRLGLKLPDAIILASADCQGCILVTRNSKDFSAKDPRIRFPYPV